MVEDVIIGQFQFTLDTADPASGPPVLMLHGFPQTRHMRRYQLRTLVVGGFRQKRSNHTCINRCCFRYWRVDL
jgi:pimeloyl-ACP methyl ester carboxylesterase